MVVAKADEWKDDFKTFCTKYTDDLHDTSALSAEMDVWQYQWVKRKDSGLTVPETIAETLAEIDAVMYPNILAAFKILACMPITTCECERSISAFRQLKTYMRSTMGAARLNGLALLHVHYSLPLNVTEIVDKFCRSNPRRMELNDLIFDH